MNATPPIGAAESGATPEPAPVNPPPLDTRTRIVRAALEVFVEKGYGGTRVQDIAERANLTAGALYVHFPNRSRLLAEAVVMEGDRLIGELIADMGEVRPGDLRVPNLMADQAAADTSVFDRLLLETFALAARDEEARSQLEAAMAGLEDAVRAKVRFAMDNGAADPAMDNEAVTAFYVIWIMGMIVHRGIGRPRPERDPFFDVCVHMVRGFSGPA